MNNNDPLDVKFQHWLSLLRGVESRGDYFVALCPAHQDDKQSLSTSIGDKGIVATCHAGCTFPAICHAVGVTQSWAFPREEKPVERMVAEWIYRDEIGTPLFRVCRFEDGTVGESGKPKKTFRQQSPKKGGGWKNGVKGVRQVPYRLPEIVTSSGPVLIVEGEKQADALAELGHVATCNAGGAGKWHEQFGECLEGRDVIVLPDNDRAGREHARDAHAKLLPFVKSVKIAVLPNLPPKGDVIDFLSAGGSPCDLQAAIDAAGGLDLIKEEPVPPADESSANDPVLTSEDRQICDALGLFVYGEAEGGRIKVFSRCHRKTEFIRDVNKLTVPDLLRLCGPVARQVAYVGTEDKPDGTWRLSEIKAAIATLAGFRRVTDRSELGVGVWLCRSEGRDRDSIVLVNAGEASILNGVPGLQQHKTPDYGEQLLDLSESDPWFDHGFLSHYASQDQSWRRDVTSGLEEIYSLWKFQDQEMTPAILTGLTLATWLQSIWDWRPQVSVSGKSGSGKTTLFGFLAGQGPGDRGLFGRLAIKSSDSSAAGLRQSVRNTSRILICDEIEAGRHRSEIYEMLRNAGRGDETLRGTAGQKATGFSLRHLVWVAATESGLIREPDKNRFIAIELLKPSEDEIGRLRDKLPYEDEAQTLGEKLLAVAVTIARDAKALALRLKQTKPHGVDHRVVESYVVPAACYAAAMGFGEDDSIRTLNRMLLTIDDESATPAGDEDRLLSAILGSIIEIKAGERDTVGQAIVRASAGSFSECNDALGRVGISVIERERQAWWIGEGSHGVFFNSQSVTRHLLRGTEWERTNITQMLKRIPGAMTGVKVRVAGIPQNGTVIGAGTVLGNAGTHAEQ